MPSHSIPETRLQQVNAPTGEIVLGHNELVQLWEQKHGLALWDEIAKRIKIILAKRSIKDTDKLKALIAAGQLVMLMKRSGAHEKGGVVTVNVTTQSAIPEKIVNVAP
jgi:hypothetical protein